MYLKGCKGNQNKNNIQYPLCIFINNYILNIEIEPLILIYNVDCVWEPITRQSFQSFMKLMYFL